MLASILFGLAKVTGIVLNLAMIAMFMAIMVNLLNADPYNAYVRMIRSITEPLCRPFRKLTRRYATPLDLSQIIVILIIIFLMEVIPRYLLSLAQHLESSPLK